MLFNSIEFIALFLPLTLAGYYLLAPASGTRFLALYLSVASLLFYSIASVRTLPILIASILANYIFALLIYRNADRGIGRLLVATGVCLNLGCLAWFKYLNFGLTNLNLVLGTQFEPAAVLLPLGISFYTFKQACYLIDVSRGEVKPGSLIEHLFAVIFFPQLIAGPIVLHRDLFGQISAGRLGRFAGSNLVVGISIFAIGLFKRTFIADSATPFSDAIFDRIAGIDRLDFLSAWTAALCYTLQLYFDFSGYSDMAVGVGRMFGIKLPINFYSPLKARSIIDYWRRWHMTLQHIIGRYVFQPLLIPPSRFSAQMNLGRWSDFVVAIVTPTLITFALSGLWHGAGWSFILWGIIHGFYVSINEAWRLLNRRRRKKIKTRPGFAVSLASHLLTLAAVVFANVLFRSDQVADAIKIWSGMLRVTEFDWHRLSSPVSTVGLMDSPIPVLVFGFGVVFLLPNTHQFFHKFASVIDRKAWLTADASIVNIRWRPTIGWAATLGFVFCTGVVFMLRVPTKFIYFNF